MTRAVVDEFIESAGGIDAPFVIVPTALEGEDWGEEYMARSFLVRAGAKDVTVLHTRDPEVADTDEFVDPLLRAKGVWFDGGRQWRLADAYLKTKALDEFETRSQAGAWERLSPKLRFARVLTDSLSQAILPSFRWEN